MVAPNESDSAEMVVAGTRIRVRVTKLTKGYGWEKTVEGTIPKPPADVNASDVADLMEVDRLVEEALSERYGEKAHWLGVTDTNAAQPRPKSSTTTEAEIDKAAGTLRSVDDLAETSKAIFG